MQIARQGHTKSDGRDVRRNHNIGERFRRQPLLRHKMRAAQQEAVAYEQQGERKKCVGKSVSVKEQAYEIKGHAQEESELIVDGDWRDGKCTGLTLTGPSKEVFRGTIDLDAVEMGDEIE